VSQISTPTSDHAPPEPFVHDTEPAFHVMTEPPVVYPVPPPSSVMFAVAVGALVPSRI
jgi:hypothetical protein